MAGDNASRFQNHAGKKEVAAEFATVGTATVDDTDAGSAREAAGTSGTSSKTTTANLNKSKQAQPQPHSLPPPLPQRFGLRPPLPPPRPRKPHTVGTATKKPHTEPRQNDHDSRAAVSEGASASMFMVEERLQQGREVQPSNNARQDQEGMRRVSEHARSVPQRSAPVVEVPHDALPRPRRDPMAEVSGQTLKPSLETTEKEEPRKQNTVAPKDDNHRNKGPLTTQLPPPKSNKHVVRPGFGTLPAQGTLSRMQQQQQQQQRVQQPPQDTEQPQPPLVSTPIRSSVPRASQYNPHQFPPGSTMHPQQGRQQQQQDATIPLEKHPQQQRQQQHPRQPRPGHPPQHRSGGRGRPTRRNAITGTDTSSSSSATTTTTTTRAPAWTMRVWKTVERGLDGLADLDSTLADRAQQLYSSSVAAASNVVPHKVLPVGVWGSSSTNTNSNNKAEEEHSGSPGSASTVRPRRRWRTKPAETASAAPQQMDMSRFRKTVLSQPGASTTAKKDPTTTTMGKDAKGGVQQQQQKEEPSISAATDNPYGILLERSIVRTSSVGVVPATGATVSSTTTATTKSVDWANALSGKSTSKLIRANGGASVPDESGRTSQKASSSTQSATATATALSATPRPPLQNRQQQPARPPTATARPPQRRRRYPDEDEDAEQSVVGRILSFLPPLPNLKLNPFRQQSSFADYSTTVDAWNVKDDESNSSSSRVGGGFWGRFVPRAGRSATIPRTISAATLDGNEDSASLFPPAPLADLLNRCDHGKSVSLVSPSDKATCRRIGRSQACLDLMALALALVGVHSVPMLDFPMPWSLSEAVLVTLPWLVELLQAMVHTWAPHAFVGAFLALASSALVGRTRERSFANRLASAVEQEAQYGALFLRLETSEPYHRRLPGHLGDTVRVQVASNVAMHRLRTFVNSVVVTFVLMTMSVVGPLVAAFKDNFQALLGHGVSLPSWSTLFGEIPQRCGGLVDSIRQLVEKVCAGIAQDPLTFGYELSIVFALLLSSFLPRIHGRRAHHHNIVSSINLDESEGTEEHEKITDQIAELGSSSATRLDLLAEKNGAEALLERWTAMRPEQDYAALGQSVMTLVRLSLYRILSCVILSVPLLVYSYAGLSSASSKPGISLVRWDSLVDLAIILTAVYMQVWKSLTRAFGATESETGISGFLSSLADAVSEKQKRLTSTTTHFALHSSVSPSAGLAVKDVWAAHTTKRAWGIRGAALTVRSGEVLVLLGDEGSGKTRLLTTIAEAVYSPPKKGLSSNLVRGSVSLGGLDVTKWDSQQLRKRMGLLLSDVRTAGTRAQALSGLTLEEILLPSSSFNASPNTGSSERSSMNLAVRIVGLGPTLLSKLPMKLATVVTANEEDLTPSALKPRSTCLSPTQWSKVQLVKLLAQMIADNDNSNNQIENCLVGTCLLLDDPTLHFSEVDEAKFIRDLRQTGAATLFTSNKWATGRFADKIAVIKDGAIIESGTHNELLGKGPQHSVYAAKWYAMTSQ